MPFTFPVYDWKTNRVQVLKTLQREIESFLAGRSAGVVTVRLSDPAKETLTAIPHLPEPCPPAK
jgi:hypothetical protein